MLEQDFTCSQFDTQRGESVNSVLKEKGLKKRELRTYNLQRLLEHISDQLSRNQARCLDQICNLIKKNQKDGVNT